MNPVAIRLLNQQLIVPQFKTPTEVVSHMGAMLIGLIPCLIGAGLYAWII